MRRLHLKTLCVALTLATTPMLAERADGAVLRYRASGDWTQITDGATPGWGPNPVGVGVSLPGASDDARINFGGNTVSVNSAVPAVSRVQIGVDESGTLEVNNGGVITANLDVLAGNNNSNATGTLVVNDGGVVNINRIFWSANDSSNGVVDIRSGGLVTVASHLWWGTTGAATIDIAGTVLQTGGILGLGTNNAATPTGGTATVTIQDGGLLALNNISSAGDLPSIQAGSSVTIEGSGQLTMPNGDSDFVDVLNAYIDAGKLLGAGPLAVDVTTNPGFTTAYIIPEPAGLLLVVLAVPAVARRTRR